ncbi:HEAT repeat domain-containing protein [Streptomyces sp. NBC_00237]|uniref:HEAT repeat domain-containing protein n=1 Tax=Streptomyces sp. NBC_00237 TaxID=2975687 RepID=UPI00225398CE|nr:HEAT repeat domain-containing protein [Streptomyces sp. NBC_00237]MCX5205701.1 HEAT repeat domain-containing protein [Streptomyces sp. NBC_00237]
MLTSEDESHEAVRRLAAGVALDQALDITDPQSWIGLDFGVRNLAWQRPELFHSNASPSGRWLNWNPGASLPTVTWSQKPGTAELALALCHPDGRIREAALDHAEEQPALFALVIIRCADWAVPVRERARALLAKAPPRRLAAHAALILRVGGRSRGDFAQELLAGALRAGPAAQTETLLASGDRATARLAHRVAVERRLLPAARLARLAARHRDVVVQDLCAEAALAALGAGTAEEFTEVVVPLLGSRQPRVRSAGVTALRRAGRHADAEPYLTDQSAVVRACARWVLRQGGTDSAPLYRALCADPSVRPAAAVGLGECGTREDADLIRALLAHPNPRVRACAVAGLRELEAVRVDDVRPLLNDPSAAVVRQATAALLPWADRLPQELLRELLTEDRQRHQRVAAVRLLRALRVHVRL